MGSGGFVWEGGAELVAAPVPLQSDYIVTSGHGCHCNDLDFPWN